MSVLVTGGTGFLGRHVVQELYDRKTDVRVLARSRPHDFPTEGAEFIEGSLLDDSTLRRACKGAKQVYHCAGFVSRSIDDTSELMRVHVDGTRRLLEIAQKSGVSRVVTVSSSGTLGVSTDANALATENDPYPMEILVRWPYYLSKVYQERESLEFAARNGLEVVCINPSLLLGPGDSRLSSTQDVLDFIKGHVPVVPSGGLSFVDVRDVAKAALLAMEKGRSGQRYLLGAANWTFERFLRQLEQISGVLAPRVRLPRRAAEVGIHLLDAVRRVTGRDLGSSVTAEMAQHYWYMDSQKARSELGFCSRAPEETLVDTVKYLQTTFLVGEPSYPTRRVM